MRHFTTVLRLQSEFDEKELKQVRQWLLREDLAVERATGELALSKLKSDKTGSSSGILPEMVNVACAEEFLELLLALVHTVWDERRVPQELADAIFIPIPKKGNLSDCKQELFESQCGFRKGHSYSDMILPSAS